MTEIRITHQPFINRILQHAEQTGEKTATKVVERLANERLAQLEVRSANHDREGGAERKDSAKDSAASSPGN